MEKIKNFFADWTMFEKIWLITASVIMIVLSFVWGDSMLALISGLTGMVSVVLCAKGKISNYAFGLVNALTYAYLCWGQKLYGEVMYNTVYMLPVIAYGIFSWKKNMADSNTEVKARNLTAKGWIILIVGTIAAILAYRQILTILGGSLAWMDAMSTVFSAIAALLMVNRYSEQWVMWIVVNGVSVLMWGTVLMKGELSAIATVVMWSAYLLNSTYGYINWRKMAK